MVEHRGVELLTFFIYTEFVLHKHNILLFLQDIIGEIW